MAKVLSLGSHTRDGVQKRMIAAVALGGLGTVVLSWGAAFILVRAIGYGVYKAIEMERP